MLSAFIVFSVLGAAILAETQAPGAGIHIRGFQLQTIIGFVTPKIIEWAKASKAKPLQFIQPGNPKVARWTASIVAAATTIGIGVSFSGDFWSSDGGTVTLAHISIPFMVQAGLQFSSAWVYQWMVQHSMFEAFWKPQPAVVAPEAPATPTP
jgi:hypothetical protein